MTDTVKSKRTRRFTRTPTGEVPTGSEAALATPEGAVLEASASPAPKAESKIAQIIALLQRKEGTTLEEMVTVTGWLPHTTRAALTGLKRKGHTISSAKADGVRRYYAVTPQ